MIPYVEDFYSQADADEFFEFIKTQPFVRPPNPRNKTYRLKRLSFPGYSPPQSPSRAGRLFKSPSNYDVSRPAEDAPESGRAIRVLSVVDAYTRECRALEADTSFASRRVTRVLEGIVAERGAPQAIRCDNGPELTSRHFLVWWIDRKIELVHIPPGRPMQNGRVESFNGRMREECLNVSWFGNLFEARERIAVWRREYNEERPHSSLGYRTPEEFARGIGGEKGCGKGAAWKSKNHFSTPLGNPANGAGFPLSHSPGGDDDYTAEQVNGSDVVF